MPRELKPCGTRAAAQRHRRKGEEVCPDCKAAEREHRRKYARQDRAEKTIHVDFGGKDTTDPLTIAKENLAIVTATLRSNKCLPKDIVPLTKRREELAAQIQRLNQAEEEEKTEQDGAEVADDGAHEAAFQPTAV
ncbi:hypothetical protein M3B43_11905 [Nesterenkonia massiliensis]|uniref:Terminase small subunit n=1 Tax=Nesterenkonia massiliensis TaxID=1232429 RepID=A0ABT2HTI3_9MICC|nr:hypothetical protein [Nesterenkonia massiliensis]MCT1608005.1 hypothetical protein [Nesterenkonia massiliensis]